MTSIIPDHGLLLDATDRAAAQAEAADWCAARGLDDEDVRELRIPDRIRRAWRETRDFGGFVDRTWPGCAEVWIAHLPEHLLTEESP
jgi:hypothetical protein